MYYWSKMKGRQQATCRENHRRDVECPHRIYACGKVKELTHELTRYLWDIVGLAEIRYTTTEEGHNL